MNNQECKIKTEIININTNEPLFYPYSIKINRCKGSFNTINDPYAKICVPDQIKDTNVKVFNLMSRTNETRHIKWHRTCNYIRRLDARICNKQKWNDGKCRCECKELIDRGVCDKGFIWNPSNCECDCDKSCGIVEYLGYKNCKCRKKIIYKLTEECSENINGNEVLYNETYIISSSGNETSNSCIVCIILFLMFLIISISMAIYVYFFIYLKNKSTNSHYLGCLNINGY